MASLYDGYQLANSNSVVPFQGSTLNELVRVADVMQQRYDATEQYAEGLQTMAKNAKVAAPDKGLYAQREGYYKEQLAGLTNRPDLENVHKDVGRLARGFANEYKNFQDNAGRIAAYQEELDKAVKEKQLSREMANLKLAQSLYQYKGMKYDPNSGRYEGQFTNQGYAREVDITEKIKKAVGDIAADSQGTVVESPNGDYFIKRGSELKQVTSEEIQQRLAAAYKTDAEWQADVNQRADLLGWSQAVKIKPKDMNPQDLQRLEALSQQTGKSFDELKHAMYADRARKEVLTNMGILADKYAFRDSKTSLEFDGTTIDGQKKANETDAALLEIGMAVPGTGTELKTVGDFEATTATAETKRQEAGAAFKQFLTQRNIVKGAGGKVYRIDPDGKRVDVTHEADAYRNQIKAADLEAQKLKSVEAAARQESGYNPKVLGSVGVKANEEYERTKKALQNVTTGGTTHVGRGGTTTTGGRKLTPMEIEQRAQAAKEIYIQNNSEGVPGYKAYLGALQRRLNPAAESTSMILINDSKTKEMWSSNLTALTSQLGLERGAVSFKIGSGKDQGAEITADQYDELKGKVEVVGFDTDRTGNTIIKARAFANVKGKKTEGEDLVLNLGGTNVDAYLQKKLPPEQFAKFKAVGMVKSVVNNSSKTGEIFIPNTNTAATISSKDGKWVVSLPQQGSVSATEIPVDSYEGVLSVLQQASAKYK